MYPDTGYIEIDGLGQYPWEEHVAKFQAKYGDDLDETQAARWIMKTTTAILWKL
jgi:hypothetical protein